ncbi:hypothetical protein SK128_023813, partial [Halocaridina rubra]
DYKLLDRWMSRPQYICWRPSNLHSLENTSYCLRLENISRVMHIEDFREVRDSNALKPYPIEDRSMTTLRNGFRCCWFGIIEDDWCHNWYGCIGCQVPFRTFMDTFQPNCYFVEVRESRTANSPRLLFSTQDVSSLDVTKYNPQLKGGPWYRDEKGIDWYNTECRRYNNTGFNMHPSSLEFIISLSDQEYKKLYELCKVMPVNHSSMRIRMSCKKYIPSKCPCPWSKEETYEKLKTQFPSLLTDGKLIG